MALFNKVKKILKKSFKELNKHYASGTVVRYSAVCDLHVQEMRNIAFARSVQV